jgi:hypothetical protein
MRDCRLWRGVLVPCGSSDLVAVFIHVRRWCDLAALDWVGRMLIFRAAQVLAQAGGSLRCALRVLGVSVLALMGRVQLEEFRDFRYVGVVCGVNLAQHLDRLLRLADSLGDLLFIASSSHSAAQRKHDSA